MDFLKKIKWLTLFLLIIFCQLHLAAQQVTVPVINSRNVPINYGANRINNSGLHPVYKKLMALQKENKGVVRIVQIGDSHIQADFLSSVVRNGLQKAFGNAGRGLVFPYQVARSNGPSDIKSSSNTGWKFNRLSHQEIPLECGVSGFCIQTSRPGSNISFLLQPDENGMQSFKHLKIFTDSNAAWLLRTDSSNITQLKKNADDSNQLFHEVLLESPVTGFTLNAQTTGETQSFYGASLETDLPGIIYSSIGVNGAKYDQYNATNLFWKQLPALKADLYIISLGTNEAQAVKFDEAAFAASVNKFVEKIRAVSPEAVILITTAVDSYKGGRPNKVLQQLNNFLSRYTSKENIPLWDLYRATLGYSASRNWIRKGLMARDKVHFTKPGYELQGALLLNVLLKGYNDYYSNHQN